ncbi:MAG: MOFRL family protein, partial [Thermoplasmatales archaeon]
NLELCLRVLTLIEDGEKVYFGSFGTDGIDGSSDAMGALVDNETLSILGREKIEDFLSRSESLSPLLESHDVLFTGPTGTNVSDIFIIYYTRE